MPSGGYASLSLTSPTALLTRSPPTAQIPERTRSAWLIWHLSRIQDDHVADLAHVEQVWPEWRERFGLPFGKWATGYGQGPQEVAERPA